MAKILILHADFSKVGGAELYALKMVNEILSRGHNVDVLACGVPKDFESIRKWSGLDLLGGQLNFINALPIIEYFISSRPMSLLRYSIVLNVARKMASSYDYVFSTYGEFSISHPGKISLIHVPLYSTTKKGLAFLGVTSSGFKLLARKAYALFCKKVAALDEERCSEGFFIANSQWTKNELCLMYNLPESRVKVVYVGAETAIKDESPNFVQWSGRSNTIVILGRVVPQKKIDVAINLIKKLRCQGADISLLIIGRGTGAYADFIGDEISGYPFIRWEKDFDRPALEKAVSNCKWGLHCAEYEHYGIAALELQMMGCITVVPNSCGQAEVGDPTLLYSSEEELCSKFEWLLSLNDAQVEDLHLLRRRIVNDHTHEKFKNKCNDVLHGFGL